MILQAQALDRAGEVVIVENREVWTAREAAEFRRQFEHEHHRAPHEVNVVSACGRRAIGGLQSWLRD